MLMMERQIAFLEFRVFNEKIFTNTTSGLPPGHALNRSELVLNCETLSLSLLYKFKCSYGISSKVPKLHI